MQSVELNILHSIQSLFQCKFMDYIMGFFTTIGDKGMVWFVVAIILFYFKKTRKIGICVFISLICGVILGNGILKHLVARNRPFNVDNTLIVQFIKKPSGYSFPSGHTLASFEAAGSILLYNKRLGIISLIVAFLIAFSRLYFGVHYPTDVLGGMILGTIIAIFVHNFWEHVLEKNKSKKYIRRY